MSYEAVVLLSGGMDSTTLLYNMVKSDVNVAALSVNYNQRHQIELEYAKRTAKKLGVYHEILDLSNLSKFIGASALTDLSRTLPEGMYDAPNMSQTVVPNRNSILLNIAVGWAMTLGAEEVLFAAHSGDHPIYPDCRPEFVARLNHLIDAVTEDAAPTIYAPFIRVDKTEIARLGGRLGVPWEDTWSCYRGQGIHCGRCGTCVERIEALFNAQQEDPTTYDEGAYEETLALLLKEGRITV